MSNLPWEGGLHILSWENSSEFVNLNLHIAWCAPLNIPWPTKFDFVPVAPRGATWSPVGNRWHKV